MLDSFEILTTSGVVLWSKQYVSVSSNIVNALITDVFIEERIPSAAKTGDDNRASRNTPYRKEKYTLKWTTAKDLGLIFVVRLAPTVLTTPTYMRSGCLPIAIVFDMGG